MSTMRIKMISGDRDWLQLVGPGVEWYDPIRDVLVDEEGFFAFTGYRTTRAFVQGKALQGDTSDNISAVGGIGEKGAMELLAYHGSIEELKRKFEAKEPMKLSKAVTTLLTDPNRFALFERNMKLMDLRNCRRPEPGELINRPGRADPEKFQALCRRLMFASILREQRQFLASFGIQPAVAAA